MMPSKLVVVLATATVGVGVNKYYATPMLSLTSLWTSLSIFLLPFSCWFIYRFFLFPKYFSPFRDLATPPGGSWLLGHAVALLSEPFGISIRAWVNELPHDGLIKVPDIFGTEFLLIANPAALADVLVHKCYDFEKPPQFRKGAIRLFGDGILFAEREVHKNQRKHLMPAFTFRTTKNFYPMFWEKSKNLIQVVTAARKLTTPSNISEDIEVEVLGLAAKTALDIVGVSALDMELNSLKDPDAEMNGIYRRLFSTDYVSVALDFMAMFLPIWLLERIPVQRNRDLLRNFEIIQGLVHSRVSARNQKQHIGQSAPTDIISVALESGHFTEADIVNQMMTFLVAGHETTASALAWAIYVLCKRPDIQARLREELTYASLPNATDPTSTITSASIDSLPYLAAVCNETLRLYPPVAMTVRTAAHDTTILNHPVPKGTLLVLPPWCVNTAIALWGPDATEFKPERWLEPGMANSGGAESNFAFLTFLHGPRSCIGQAFAKGELMCMLAAWVGSFETRLRNEGEEVLVDVKSGVAVKPKGGLWVKVRPTNE